LLCGDPGEVQEGYEYPLDTCPGFEYKEEDFLEVAAQEEEKGGPHEGQH
jgi:hypothetical protein